MIALCIAALCLSGCDVLAEINSEIGYSDEELGKKPAEKPAPAGASGQEGPPPTYAQQQAAWWQKARSLGPREESGGSDAMVRCRVKGSERFTRAGDCVAVGGSVVR